MKAAADRVPEETWVSERAWEAIMKEILAGPKPYLDVESDVVMEQFIFTLHRDPKETMAAFITRILITRREFNQSLGTETIVCSHCHGNTTRPRDIPMEMWSFMLRRAAKLTPDHQKLMHQWDADNPQADRFMQSLLKQDRSEPLNAQSLVGAAPKSQN